MSVLGELVEKLEANLASAKEQIAEFEKGKKAAAGRLRKDAQAAKGLWQEVRVQTMSQLKAMPTRAKAPKTEAPVTPAS